MVLFFGFRKTTRTFFPTSKPLNILDGALFVACFVLYPLFILFCGILACSCISCVYPVAVYNANTPSKPYCLSLTAENVPLTFGDFLWSWKDQTYLFCYFQSSKIVARHLVRVFSACKYVISAVLRYFNF